MYGYMGEQVRREYENMLDTLTVCQTESTQFVPENQEPTQLKTIEKRVAVCVADLEDTAKIPGMFMRICGYGDIPPDLKNEVENPLNYRSLKS